MQRILITAMLFTPAAAFGQTAPGDAATFRSASTMVTVPALVRGPSGGFATGLDARDFALFDNGLPQQLKLANLADEPVAMVVIVQTGGAANRHFFDYADLPDFLDWMTGGTTHEIMLVTFDSRVQLIWHFPLRSDGVAYSMTHLNAGDRGAALLDAVQLGVQQLQSEPGSFRRIVLLISQETDQGSSTAPEEALRALGKGSTAVYALTFVAPKAKSVRGTARSRHRMDEETPLAAAVKAMREHTATQLAAYTGGVHLTFSTRREFDEAIQAIANDIRNRYVLAFQPAAHDPGIHRLTVQVRKGLSATARDGYWFDPIGDDH